MKKVLLLILIIGFASSSFGQRLKNSPDSSAYLHQLNRIEFEISEHDYDFQIINGENDGLMVLRKSDVRTESGFRWVMYKLGKYLEIEWTKMLIVPFTVSILDYDYSKGFFYLLFTSEQDLASELTVYAVDQKDGHIMIRGINTGFPLSLTHFEVVNEEVLLVGTTNFRPVVLTFSLSELKPRVIPGIYAENVGIVDVTIDDERELFTIVTMVRLINKRYTASVKTFTTDNLMLLNSTIDPGEKKTLIDGAATSFSNGFQYVAGAYSNKNIQQSQGLYLGKFVNGQQQFIKYYNYDELENFFGYLPPSRQNRINGRIEKRKSKGKRSKFNYRLLVHEMIDRGNEVIMVAEAYYPRYSNYSPDTPITTYGYHENPGYSSAARSGIYYSTKIVSYRYTHAVVVAFDRNGNILWDQSFPLENVLTPSLRKFITVNAANDRIELLYVDKNTIRSKIVAGNKVIEGEAYTPVKMLSEADANKDKDPKMEGMEQWYGNVMIAFGEQEIERRDSNRIKSNRNVFYINKVKYHPVESDN